MQRLQLKSLAKINLGLNVIEKRDDGFHNIETIFYPINIFDELTFEKSNDFKFISNNKALQQDPQNLILKSKNLLDDFTGKKLNVSITLKKNIPIGAGLGGGSSNCASTLLALNELFCLNIEKKILDKIALTLGSDVPFFIDPKPSLAFSRGEILKEIELNISLPILIVNPKIHISTKWAFENIQIKNRDFHLNELDFDNQFRFENSRALITNDFEEIVFTKYPELSNIKTKLYDLGAIFSLMSGSGSTVYGIFNNIEVAEKAKTNFNKNYFTEIHYEKN